LREVIDALSDFIGGYKIYVCNKTCGQI